jgi:hypothetical protein
MAKSQTFITVKSNIDGVLAQFDQLTDEFKGKALTRAMNRTGQRSRTIMTREVRKEYNVKATDIKNTIRIKRNYLRNTTKGIVSIILESKGRRLPFGYFAPKQNAVGTSVKIKKARKMIPSAFVTQLQAKMAVAKRKGKSRLPIDQLYTISIPEMLNAKNVRDAVLKAIQEELDSRIMAELNYRALKAAGKVPPTRTYGSAKKVW